MISLLRSFGSQWSERGVSSFRGVTPKEMEGLLSFALREGLSEEEAQKVLRLNRPVTDAGWVEAEDLGSEALLIAKETMEAGRYLEYACYESTGAPQGRAVLRLQSWEEEGVLKASHGECSDPYYQWYADHDVRDRGAVYHVCTGRHSTCRFKLPRGDRRIVIHLDRWRLLSPAIMVRSDYMREKGETWGRVVLKEAAAAKKSGAPPPRPLGDSGIEAALAEAAEGGDFPPPAPEQPERRAGEERASGSKEEVKKRRLEEHVREQMTRQDKRRRSKSPSRKRRNKDKSKKDKNKGRRRDSSEDSSGGRSSSASSHFQAAPARGGELWRQAQKKPGRLAQRSLDEMCRYLADRHETAEGDLTWAGQKVVAYLNPEHRLLILINIFQPLLI